MAIAVGSQARAVEQPEWQGRPLQDVLNELTGDGVRFLFSSQLVPRSYRVTRLPPAGDSVAVASALLSEYDLGLKRLAPGLYAVVRLTRPARSETAASTANERDGPAARESQATVVVVSHRFENATGDEVAQRMSASQMIARPELGDDALRSLQSLPGVTQSGLSGQPNIRGGATNEVLVLLDGFPLRQAFHLPGYYSMLSILDPSTIASMDVYMGGIPARYGGRMSGVLDLRTLESRHEPRYELGVSSFNAHGRSALEIAGGRAEWLMSARLGTLGYVLNSVAPHIGHPNFADVYSRVQLWVDANNTLEANLLFSRDAMSIARNSLGEVSTAASRVGYGWIRAEHRWSDARRLSVWAGVTNRANNRAGSIDSLHIATGTLDERRLAQVWDVRAQLDWNASAAHTLQFGGEWSRGASRYRYASEVQFDSAVARYFHRPATVMRDLDVELVRQHAALFVSDRWRVTPQLTSEIGARAERMQVRGAGAHSIFDPRVALTYEPWPQLRLQGAYGFVHQYRDVAEIGADDFNHAEPLAQSTTYLTVGIDRQWEGGIGARLDAYRKQQVHLYPRYTSMLNQTSILPELGVGTFLVAPGTADIHGVELSIEGNHEPWAWNLSYGWSQAHEEFPGLRIARDWDQGNSLTIGVHWSRGPWSLSGASTQHSGLPATQVITTTDGELIVGRRNAKRYANYTTVDLRAAWQRPLPSGTLNISAALINALNRTNACCTELAVRRTANNRPQFYVKELGSLPLLPWLSVSWTLGKNAN